MFVWARASHHKNKERMVSILVVVGGVVWRSAVVVVRGWQPAASKREEKDVFVFDYYEG